MSAFAEPDCGNGAKICKYLWAKTPHIFSESSYRMQVFKPCIISMRVVCLLTLFFLGFANAAAPRKSKLVFTPQVLEDAIVTAVAFSPNGRTMASLSEDDLKLWDAESGKLLRTFSARSGTHTDRISFSTDGQNVIYFADEGHNTGIKITNAATGELVHFFDRGAGPGALSPDGRIMVSGHVGTRWLMVWDVTNGKNVRSIEPPERYAEPASEIVFMPNRDTVIADNGSNFYLVDLATGKVVRTFKGHAKRISSIAVSSDGRTVASASEDGTVKIWNTATGDVIRTIDGHSGSIRSIALSPDGRAILAGCGDMTLKLWDVNSGTLLRIFSGHLNVVSSVAFSPDGRSAISGSLDRTVKFWDVNTGNQIRSLGRSRTYKEITSWQRSLVISPDGRTAVSHSGERPELWDITRGRFLRDLETSSRVMPWVAYLSDGRTIIANDTSKFYRWDSATGKLLPARRLEQRDWGSIVGIDAAALSHNGRMIAVSSRGSLELWDVMTGEFIRKFATTDAFQFSANYRRFNFTSDDRGILGDTDDAFPGKTNVLWEVATGEVLSAYDLRTTREDAVSLTVLSSDGHTAASKIRERAYGKNRIVVWDVTTGSALHSIPVTADINSIAFSPNGQILVTGHANGNINVWNVNNGELTALLEGHAVQVASLTFAPDGRTLGSMGRDGSFRLWSIDRRAEELQVFSDGEGGWVTVTPAGFFNYNGYIEDLLHLVSGMDVLSIGQTFEHLYRSDLVEALLQGDLEGKYADAAYKLNLDLLLSSGPAPQIEHIGRKDDRAGDTIRLSLRLTGKGGGIGGRVSWKVNGVTQGDTTPAALAKIDDPLASVVVTETLKLVPGKANIVEFTAYNRAGLIATPPFKITVDKFGVTTAERPRMFVLALGVNRYRMRNYQLTFAAADATSFVKALTLVGGALFSKVESTLLTDEEVSEKRILQAVNNIAAEATQDDVFVLFLGGHGKSIEGRYYYYPQALDFAANQSVIEYGIGQDKWEAWLAKIAVQKSLLVIDTCEGDAFRGSRGTDTARETAMAQLQHATGRNVISATRDAAYEGYHGHGVLTYALLEALDINAAHDGDMRVRIGALADYVEQRVPEITRTSFGVEQLPTRKLSGNDFPIGIRQPVLEIGSEESTIPKEPTHVLIRAELLRERPFADAPGSRQLTPGMLVRVVEFLGTWAVIARDGHKLGYLPADALARVQ